MKYDMSKINFTTFTYRYKDWEYISEIKNIGSMLYRSHVLKNANSSWFFDICQDGDPMFNPYSVPYTKKEIEKIIDDNFGNPLKSFHDGLLKERK